jgi:hypothetical protein
MAKRENWKSLSEDEKELEALLNGSIPGIPAEQVLAELEAIDREETEKRKRENL